MHKAAEAEAQTKLDANHATDTKARKSCTGFLVFLNQLLVNWMPGKQKAGVESIVSLFSTTTAPVKAFEAQQQSGQYPLNSVAMGTTL